MNHGTLTKFLHTIDMFGVPVSMNFYGRAKSKSRSGGVCSLLLMLFYLFSIYSTTKDFFSLTNPKTSSSDFYNDDPPEMILSSKIFPLAFQLQTSDGAAFIDDKIYKFNMFHIKIETITHNNGTIEEILTNTTIETERCTAEHFGSLAPKFALAINNPTFCISLNQSNFDKVTRIQGVYGSSIFQNLNFQVFECDNDTSLNSCAPQDKIRSLISGAWLGVIYPSMVVDLQNYDSPDSKFMNPYFILMNPDSRKSMYVGLGYIDVATDAGWLIEDIEVKKYVKTNQVKETAQPKSEYQKLLVDCTFEADKLATKYSRTYKKVQDSMAEIGGLTNTAFIVILVITTPYFKYKYREALMNELFDVIQTPKERKRKKSQGKNKDRENKSQHTENKHEESKIEQNTEMVQIKINDSKYLPSEESPISKEKRRSISPRKKVYKETKPHSLTEFSNPINISMSKVPATTNNIEKNLTKEKPSISVILAPVIKEAPTQSHLMPSIQLQPAPDLEISKECEDQHANTDLAFFTCQSIICNRIHSYCPHQMNFQTEQKESNSSRLGIGVYERGKEETSSPVSRAKIRSRSGGHTKTVKFNDQENHDSNDDDDSKKSNEDDQETAEEAPTNIRLSPWEFFCSYFYKTESLKKKLTIINEGIKKVNLRLDIVNIVKKLQDLDKLRVLILDHDQLLLFNNLPKPEVRAEKSLSSQSTLSVYSLLKKSTLIENYGTKDQVIRAYQRLIKKQRKTLMDQKILKLYDHED